ncbi:unnamed protein product [Lactuca saligna]|uniref:Uncharacterized protein n=1 Tax=Lactuca saligna TaxID=75948 RepID=A0AA36EGD9_LACSI|nr:unnamed protein product [Lactuca saligna]
MDLSLAPKKFENSTLLIDSIPVAEFQSQQLAVHPPGALTISRELLDASIVVEATSMISCWGEDKTELGKRVGRIYESVMEDVLRWATCSVEIFFSRNNALLASSSMKILQRVANHNVAMYPFIFILLIEYCFPLLICT